MKKFKSSKENPRIVTPVRVTTDAVHRRFNAQKDANNTKANEKSQGEERNNYFCMQCNQELPANPGKEELKSHFETIKHNQYSSCVYCSKPVYVYRHKNLEVYHICRYS